MYVSDGEQHAAILDEGINLVGLFAPDYLVGIGSSYFGEGDGGMLLLEQSPYLEDSEAARLRMLGVIAGMSMYADERSTFALSNNVSSPRNTHVVLKEGQPKSTYRRSYRLPESALEACVDISDFIRKTEGNLWSANIQFDTIPSETIRAEVSGVFISNDMREAYLRSIERGIIVQEHTKPAAGNTVASIHHTILTQTTGQPIAFSMSDHRQSWYAEKAARIWSEKRAQRNKPD